MRSAGLCLLLIISFIGACKLRESAWEKRNTNYVPIEALPKKVRQQLRGFVPVEGGVFSSGELLGRDTFSVLLRPVRNHVSDFYLQQCEVSVGDYLAFCRATNDPSNWPDTLVFERNNSWADSRGYFRKPDHPVTGVTLEQALRYIHWKSQQVNESLMESSYFVEFTLPDELQLEYAIQSPGGSSEHENVNTASWALSWAYGKSSFNLWNTGELRSSENMLLKDYYADGYLLPAPVRSMEPNKFGLYHIAGNVAEWTRTPVYSHFSDEPLSWVGDTVVLQTGKYSRGAQSDTLRMNRRCAAVLKDSSYYVTKGGSWMHSVFYTQGAAFLPVKADRSYSWLGFRMAMRIYRKRF